MTRSVALLLTLALISAAAADDGQRRCQQHPVFNSNLKP